MKALLVGLICMLSILNDQAFSQDYFPFPVSNAAWNTVGDSEITFDEWHFRYAVYGDTVINSIQYAKVYEMYDSTILHPNSTYFAAIRENDQKQIFCKIPGFPEALLYDFSLSIGDTIWYETGGYLWHDKIQFTEESHFRVVTDIDSILLNNNQYRKSWVLNGLLGPQTWVEGIGSINWYGLFNPLINCVTLNGDSYQFACFKQDDEILYLNNPFCEYCFCQLLTSIEQLENEKRNWVSVFPNPSNDIVTIRINGIIKSNCTIEIYNLAGRKQFEKTLNFESEIEIDNLQKGIYIMKAFDAENEMFEILKLIIE